MLRKCPNHGLENIEQLTIFHNGLRPDTKMILDAAVGGTMMDVDVEQATRIIDALASTDYQAQHVRQVVQKKGVLDLSTSDTLLAQNKILTQQMEAITKQLSKLPQQLQAVQSSTNQSETMKCDVCGGDHPNRQCYFQVNPHKKRFNIWEIKVDKVVFLEIIIIMHLKGRETIRVKVLGGNRMLVHLIGSPLFSNNNSLQLKIEQPSWKILWKSSCKPLWLIRRIQRPLSEVLRPKLAS